MKNNLMLKMTLRDISKNWLQYLSMIIITFLAVTLFCGFISNTLTLEKTVNDFYKKSNLADLTVQTTIISDEDKSFLENLGIDVEYRLYLEGSINQKSAKFYVSSASISHPLIVEGNKGILIDKHFAKIYNYEVGDFVSLEIPGYDALVYPITGLMEFVEVANTYNYCPVYIDENLLLTYMTEMASFYYQNQAIIKTDTVELVKEQINSYFQNKDDNNLLYVFDQDSMEAVVTLNGEVSQSLKMIYVFPVVFLLVSILVIMTTISPLILRERTNIGTMKALGISNYKIMFHYASFGVILCLVGGIIGVIVGPLIVPNVMKIKYNLVYSLPVSEGIVFSFLWSSLAILVICSLASLIGFMICYKVIKEKPAQCMRPIPPKDNIFLKSRKKEKKTNQRKLPLKMGIRNIIVKPSRAFMTIIGVTGCVALLVCSFGIGDTIDASIELELGGQFFYDISTTYYEDETNSFITQMDLLKENGEIDSYDTFKSFYMTAQGKNMKDIMVYNISSNPSFTTINAINKTIISHSTARDLGIGVGDEVTLLISGNSYTVLIEEIIETALTKGIFVSSNIFDSNYHILNMWIKAEVSDELIDKINLYNQTKTASSMQELKDSVNNAVTSIDTMKYTLMIFAISLAVVVLYNLSLLNTKERHRDIATMKVLGFTNHEISKSLLYEIMILVSIGTIGGLLLGYPITYLVMSINRIELVNFIYNVYFISYILATLISLLTAFGINLLFGMLIGRIKMIESLKSVE